MCGLAPAAARPAADQAPAVAPARPLPHFHPQVVAGLALLALSTRTFHKRASERSDARQQLRAAQEGRAARASSNGAAGHDWAVRRGAAGSAGSNVLGSGTAEHLGSGSREEGTRWLQEEPGQGQALPHRSQGAATTLASPHEQVLVRASERGQAASADSNGQHATQHAELQRYCEQHFGLDWLRRWGATARQVCSASRQLSLGNAAHAAGASGVSGSELGSGGSGGGGAWRAPSSVTCRSMNDTHMPAGSAPHVLCDVTNLRLDPSKLVGTRSRTLVACLQPAWPGGCPSRAAGRCAPLRNQTRCQPDTVRGPPFVPSCSCAAAAAPPNPPTPWRSIARAAPCTAPATCAPPPPTTATPPGPSPWTAPGRGSAWTPSARTTSRRVGGGGVWAAALPAGKRAQPAGPLARRRAGSVRRGSPACPCLRAVPGALAVGRSTTSCPPGRLAPTAPLWPGIGSCPAAGHFWQLPVPARAGCSERRRAGAAGCC